MVYSGKDLSIQRACHPRTMMRRAASLLEDWISHALTVLVLGIAGFVVTIRFYQATRLCCGIYYSPGVVLPLSTPIELVILGL
jgi:hypothetical protein